MPSRRVCLVNSMRTFGGAEVWFLDAARGLRDRGWRVSVVGQPDSALAARAVAEGFPVGEIPIRFDGAPWTLLKLAGFLRRERIDAVLCNLTKDLKAAGVAARLAGVPVVLASRESDFPLKDKLYYRWYFNRVATGVIVNSEATRRTVLASAPWLRPERVHLLYKGIDLERFHPAPAPPLDPAVGFVGKFIPRKGIEDLTEAWLILHEKHWRRMPRLLIAGEVPDDPVARECRRKLQRLASVEFRGWIEHIEVFLAGLSMLVLPSREEGFGLAAAEAAASGLPVVATRTSSLPELVRDGETGILVPPRNPIELALALQELILKPEEAAAMGRAGRRLMEERFGRERMLDELAGLLQGAPPRPEAPA